MGRPSTILPEVDLHLKQRRADIQRAKESRYFGLVYFCACDLGTYEVNLLEVCKINQFSHSPRQRYLVCELRALLAPLLFFSGN